MRQWQWVRLWPAKKRIEIRTYSHTCIHMLLQSEWHEHMMCTWTNVGNTKSMSKRLAILLRTLLQTDRQTDAEELWQKSIILRQTSCSSLCCWLLVLSSFSHTQPKIFACVFSPYIHTQNRERRIKGKSTKVFQSVLPMRMCVYVCKNERSLPACLHRCVCVCASMRYAYIFNSISALC